MTARHWLMINGRLFPFSELDSIAYTSPVEADIIAFCKAWMKGQEEFNLSTSGSTGTPTQIKVKRSEMEATALLQQEALGLKPGMNALLCLHHRFIAGKMMMVRSMITGMNLVVTPASANPLEKIPTGLKIDFAALVPYQVEHIISTNKWDAFSTDARVIIGGAAINSPLMKQIDQMPVKAYATFGMTETISHIALQSLNGDKKTDEYQTLPGVTVAADERGCLVIHAKHLEHSPIVTNDLVEVTSSGSFKWSGRWDNVINSGGIKIVPETIEREIEEIFASLKLTNRFFVAGFPHDSFGQIVVLLIESPMNADFDYIAELHDKIHARLESSFDQYQKPQKILVIPEFIETATGKINRSETVKSLFEGSPQQPKTLGRDR